MFIGEQNTNSSRKMMLFGAEYKVASALFDHITYCILLYYACANKSKYSPQISYDKFPLAYSI